MECGINGCPRPAAIRCCSVCEGASHQLCSNNVLYILGVVVEFDLCFCSVSCYSEYARAEQNAANTEQPQNRRSYTYKFKREVLLDLAFMSTYAAEKLHEVPRRTIRNWEDDREKIFAFTGSEKCRAARPGRPEIIPFAEDLVTFMKDRRRDEKVLCTVNMIKFIKLEHAEWLDNYMARNKSPYDALIKLLQRFALRHGFSRRTPHNASLPSPELLKLRDEFSRKFWKTYGKYDPRNIYNADETGVLYEMPPTRIWAEKGKSAKIPSSSKHSARLTALLTIRGDGKKLPILFILKAMPNGKIEQNELSKYPKGHFYCVQENAWMDERIWHRYLREVLLLDLQGPSVLLVDNLDCHVSGASEAIVVDELKCKLEPLPPKTTSVCQPLDVGVMGPVKSMLRTKWLAEDAPENATAEYKRHAMVMRMIQVWEEFDEDTIRKSFIKAMPCVELQ